MDSVSEDLTSVEQHQAPPARRKPWEMPVLYLVGHHLATAYAVVFAAWFGMVVG
jgi:hypothetical protein